ncbi:MAG TPA: single-stranded DNA-binding protein [Chloroflexota bacterium]|nr:single-stranded DNA-binding protein [Chloroflexota bacterium]
MAYLKKAQIIGRLGRDPERIALADGATLTTFSVAVNEPARRASDADPEALPERTTWFRINAYGRQGELTAKLLTKGMTVHAAGDLQVQEYAAAHGRARVWLAIRLESFEILTSRGGAKERPRGQEEPFVDLDLDPDDTRDTD